MSKLGGPRSVDTGVHAASESSAFLWWCCSNSITKGEESARPVGEGIAVERRSDDREAGPPTTSRRAVWVQAMPVIGGVL